MSNRSLVELNHDHCPRDDAACLALGRALQGYMGSADTDLLPYGVERKHYRHHSEPCPLAEVDRLRAEAAVAERRGRAEGMREAAAWIGDATDRMPHGSQEAAWAQGAVDFLKARAEEMKR